MKNKFFEINQLADIEILVECEEIEFKLASGKEGQGELPKDFWKTYSAMANSKGGWVILGIKEENNQFKIAGISNIEKVKQDLFNLLNNRDHISCNLLVSEEHIQSLIIDDKNVLAIYIPAATRKQKPVHLTKNPFGHTYFRLYDGDRLCDDELVKKMLAEQITDSFDNEILSPHFTFDDDIELDSLKAYRNRLSAHKPHHPYLDLDLFSFFKKIGGWKKDRSSGKEGITVAGLLMFGTFDAIISHFPHYFLDYREPSDNRWEERIVPDGTWSGNLYDFYRKVYLRLVENLKIPFNLKEDQRIDETVAHEALREALINTLAHADYSGRTPILIEKHPDKFLFRNPGNLRLSKDEILEGGVHDCRNSLLHQMFLLIGLGEKAGSGMPKILKGCHWAHWAEPNLEEKAELPQFVTLTILTSALISDEIYQQLLRIYDDKLEKLSSLELDILATICLENQVTHKRCCELTSLHSRDVTLALQRLLKNGFIESYGEMKQKIYFIPDQMGSSLEQARSKLGLSRDQVGSKSELDSQQLDHSVELTQEQQLIFTHLLQKTLSITEMVQLVGRSNRSKFRANVLAPLIEFGLVEMTIPNKPTSSKQRYRVVKK